MTVNVEYETDIALFEGYEELINRVIEAALDSEGCPFEVEVNVVITDNASIREINREYRQIDAPTDVLSFPMLEYETPGDFTWLEEDEEYNADCFNPDTGELMLGDIMISVERVLSQAEEYGHSAKRELGFLIAHSMLHLFGYDHMEDGEREIMEEKQRELLNGLGITR
ncbi:MAG: rRNA maturation RNase YbeY [Lachnospiraceae bacterium]|nr:rRNA maturation RNase YbeY [Lachnospiraceae bacterium]